MPSLLLVVFILQLAIHVINSLGAQAIDELAWLVYNKLPTPTSKAARDSAHQRRQLLRLKKELAGVSAQDDFARWAKVRRQHDKVLAEHEKNSSSLSASKTQFTTVVGGARWLGTTGLRVLLQFYFTKSPMFWLPRAWVPYSVEWILAFPRAPTGSVSVQMWAMACGSVIAMLAEAVTAMHALMYGEQASEVKGSTVQVQQGAGNMDVGGSSEDSPVSKKEL